MIARNSITDSAVKTLARCCTRLRYIDLASELRDSGSSDVIADALSQTASA